MLARKAAWWKVATPEAKPTESEEPSSQPELSEASQQEWNPKDYPDPTLRENMQANFYDWDHQEYKSFGNKEDFVKTEVKFYDETGLLENVGTIRMSLPSVFKVGEMGIDYDGGFAEGDLPTGSLQETLESEYDESKSFKDNGLTANLQISLAMFTGKVYDMVESEENAPGNYVERNNYVRGIYDEGFGNVDLIYFVKLAEKKYFGISFLVSEQATSQDLEYYDYIVESMELVE